MDADLYRIRADLKAEIQALRAELREQRAGRASARPSVVVVAIAPEAARGFVLGLDAQQLGRIGEVLTPEQIADVLSTLEAISADEPEDDGPEASDTTTTTATDEAASNPEHIS